MNVENFKLVREHVNNNPDFTMADFRHPCGSAACIIGSAEVLMLSQGYRCDDSYLHHPEGPIPRANRTDICEWLGITYREYEHLYSGCFSTEHIESLTKEDAVAFLDRCIEQGEYIMEFPKLYGQGNR